MRTCQHPDCDRPHHAGGYCPTHYRRNRAGRDMNRPIPPAKGTSRRCDIPGCADPHYALDLCRRHYMAEWLGRDPLQLPPRSSTGEASTG